MKPFKKDIDIRDWEYSSDVDFEREVLVGFWARNMRSKKSSFYQMNDFPRINGHIYNLNFNGRFRFRKLPESYNNCNYEYLQNLILDNGEERTIASTNAVKSSYYKHVVLLQEFTKKEEKMPPKKKIAKEELETPPNDLQGLLKILQGSVEYEILAENDSIEKLKFHLDLRDLIQKYINIFRNDNILNNVEKAAVTALTKKENEEEQKIMNQIGNSL